MRQGEKCVRGEVTAFLSLIFVLLLSFVGAMVESAQIQVMKNYRRADVDKAIYSAFGEYRSELLEEYELFAIEGSYETGQFSEENLITRLNHYGAGALRHEVTDVQLLTDNQGYPFREQAVAYMKDYSGIDLAADLIGFSSKWEEQEIEAGEYKETSRQTEEELNATLSENEAALSTEDNPLAAVSAAKETPLLAMILPESMTLSGKTIPLDSVVSQRSLQTGRGSFQAESNTDGTVGNLLFGEYLMQKFSLATKPNEEGVLSYELEYLIAGKGSDKDNLESVAARLLLLRMGANHLYLLSDSTKMAEAEAMAAGLATLAALPIATEIVKQALLAAWAYGESIMDLRSLLQDKKVPLVKTGESWQLELSSLLKLGTPEDQREGSDTGDGLPYKEYLRMMLFLQNKGQCSMRALDLIEQNMQCAKGLGFFRADNCVTKLNITSTAELRRGITYEFPTYFGYK